MNSTFECCPFCGSTSIECKFDTIDKKYYIEYLTYGQCKKCLAKGPVTGISVHKDDYSGRLGVNKEDAVRSWNRRNVGLCSS